MGLLLWLTQKEEFPLYITWLKLTLLPPINYCYETQNCHF